MSGHTPGPWETTVNCEVQTPFGHAIAYTAASHEQRENARLITAAPELLAFCKKLADPSRGTIFACMGLGDELRSLIAKAEGGAD